MRLGVEEPELIDIGLVGEVTAVDPDVIRALEEWDFIPVISPIGVNAAGETFNLNADTAAAAVAAALKAQKLIYLTDSEGVLDKDGALIPTIDRAASARLIRQGVIREGMIPKVNYCLQALAGGVKQAHVIDGRLEHALLLEMFTERGIGTEILAG